MWCKCLSDSSRAWNGRGTAGAGNPRTHCSDGGPTHMAEGRRMQPRCWPDGGSRGHSIIQLGSASEHSPCVQSTPHRHPHPNRQPSHQALNLLAWVSISAQTVCTPPQPPHRTLIHMRVNRQLTRRLTSWHGSASEHRPCMHPTPAPSMHTHTHPN